MYEKEKELRFAQKKLRFEIKRFMELTAEEIEEGRKSCSKIKELANDIVDLRKEIKGEKQLRREHKGKRR